jgi:uncharacterized membrane protein YqjE
MTHDLLHADLAAAAVDNLFLLVGLPLLALWFRWRRQRGRPPVTAAVVVIIAVATVGWTEVCDHTDRHRRQRRGRRLPSRRPFVVKWDMTGEPP